MQKWHVYRASLDPVVGSEQGKSRPVLVISEDAINELLNVVNVWPITTRKPNRRIYPNEVVVPADTVGLPNEPIILSYQIRTIDKVRLTLKYGELADTAKQDEVYASLCFQLGIDR
ncbi:type II toxin-antitoxin system PemK/MazF family toxin [Fibrella arboris]|uniref:type II toxin-antitoxin system PemK/MazF family toxin n=1 Tax=Fibrella arboris TaxID=3242486 RepID=UPI00352303AC